MLHTTTARRNRNRRVLPILLCALALLGAAQLGICSTGQRHPGARSTAARSRPTRQRMSPTTTPCTRCGSTRRQAARILYSGDFLLRQDPLHAQFGRKPCRQRQSRLRVERQRLGAGAGVRLGAVPPGDDRFKRGHRREPLVVLLLRRRDEVGHLLHDRVALSAGGVFGQHARRRGGDLRHRAGYQRDPGGTSTPGFWVHNGTAVGAPYTNARVEIDPSGGGAPWALTFTEPNADFVMAAPVAQGSTSGCRAPSRTRRAPPAHRAARRREHRSPAPATRPRRRRPSPSP